MASGSITLRSVAALKPGHTIWDGGHNEAVKGFGARRQKGVPVYVLKFRILGRQRFLTIGRHGSPWTPEQARREARRLLGEVASGKDPQTEKATARERAADTLVEIAKKYLTVAKATQKPRSYLETERHLHQNWKPLHTVSVFDISRRQVAARLTQLQSERGPVAAARARAALSAMFNWAIREGWEIEVNPVFGTNKPAEPPARERVLSGNELREIWTSCSEDDYGRIVKLLILTGQRREEVGGMRFSELDSSRTTWTIPSSRTKNRREHLVPLSAGARDIVPAQGGNGEFCFGEGPRRAGDTLRGFSGWSKAKRLLDDRILEKRRICDPRAVPLEWRLHDLRRTCATVMADRLGILPHVIEAILNHVSGHKAGVAGVYNRAKYITTARDALSLWAEYLRQTVAPEKAAL
ncbi:tyrosine-type recombinase/integrase [Undibacter mobilis]|uniref:DUF4102 domain-containing protein n=1 Tax=Undibacter mobilis TaxID=2292256 RepID=A0A371BAB8_9BRAD|nr:site-specific integrase [Undibacter mobilis]RDV04520.1 DUF4102 domain-containing protein [Undibacter mobilis]